MAGIFESKGLFHKAGNSGGGGGDVSSVNGRTGDVVITLAELGGQEELSSGENIKTINGQSVLGSGDLTISGSGLPQYSTMPAASVSNVGEIAQYTGADEPDTPASATIAQTTGSGLYDLSVNTATFETEEEPEGAEVVDFTAEATSRNVTFTTVDSLTITTNDALGFEIFMSQSMGGGSFPAQGDFWTYDDSGDVYCGNAADDDAWFVTTISDMEQRGMSISGVSAEDKCVATYSFTPQGLNWKKDEETVTLSNYGISYSGTPSNGDVLTVTYTPESKGKQHAFVYESKAIMSDALATISQTAGTGLTGLVVDVATFEAEEQPSGDESVVFVAGESTYNISPNTYDDVVYLSITDADAFVAKGKEYLAQQGYSTDFNAISVYISGTSGTINATSIEFLSSGSQIAITNISFQDFEDWGITFDGRGGDIDTWILAQSSVSLDATWTKAGTPVNLEDYGITYYGVPNETDALTVVYTAPVALGYKWERTDVQPAGGSGSGIDWKTKIDLPADVMSSDWDIAPYFTIEGGLPDGEYEVYYEMKTYNTDGGYLGGKPFGSMRSKIKFIISSTGYQAMITPVIDGGVMPTDNKRLNNASERGNYFVYKKGSDIILKLDSSMGRFWTTDIHGYGPNTEVPECFKLSSIKNTVTGEEFVATGTIYNYQDIGTELSGMIVCTSLMAQPDLPIAYRNMEFSTEYATGLYLNGIYMQDDSIRNANEIDMSIWVGDDGFEATLKNVPNGYELLVTKAEGVFENTQVGVSDGTQIKIKFNFPAGTTGSGNAIVGFNGTDGTPKDVYGVDINDFSAFNALKIGETPVNANYLGKILQYTGATDANYTNGYFYKVTGSIVTVPASITCVETSGNITVAMDIDNFITVVKSLTGWEDDSVIGSLNSGYQFAYDADNGTLGWGAYGTFDPTGTAQLMQYVSFSPAVSSGTVFWNTYNYVPSHKAIQNGAWALVDVQSATTLLESVTGYDATKTQILKNVSGTFTWVDE